MTSFGERLKTRVPDWPRFMARARDDRRNIAYDLLPLLDLKGREAVARALRRLKPHTRPFAPSDRARDLDAQLRRDGVTAPQPPLPDHVLADLVAWFKTQPCHDRYRPHLGEFSWDAPASDETNIGYFTTEQVLRAPHLLDLANDRLLLETAELYLGARPVIDNIGCAWHFPGREQAKGVQRFHRDFDCARNLKAFWYLTDVTETSGPHRYVRGSHADPRLDSGKAQTDAAIIAAFGAGNIISITAPAGTWFLEDVYGFHKGQLPIDRPRLLLAVEYNLYPSSLAPRHPIMRNDGRYDRYVNRLFLK
jgi:hypothetical protein